MLERIRSLGIKTQMVFWMSLISVISFSVLFTFNYFYYRKMLVDAQWRNLQAVSELVSMSTMFAAVDVYVDRGIDSDGVFALHQFIEDMKPKFGITGSDIIYQEGNNLKQVEVSGKDEKAGPGIIQLPDEVMDACRKSIHSGTMERVKVYSDGSMTYYCVAPVLFNLRNRFVVCTYCVQDAVELNMIRYFCVNVLSFMFVLVILIMLVIYASNKILIRPILEIEKTVDSFVYTVSGGYLTFYFNASPGNELVLLKNSVNRLEKLVGAHNRFMSEHDHYTDWLKNNVDDMKIKNASMDFDLKAAQYEAFCDKEVLTGNMLAWKRRCEEIDAKIQHKDIGFLQFFLIGVSDGIDMKEFIEGAMEAAKIGKEIPMRRVYRIGLHAFVFVLEKPDCLPLLLRYVEGKPVVFGYASYDSENNNSSDALLRACRSMAEIKKGK